MAVVISSCHHPSRAYALPIRRRLQALTRRKTVIEQPLTLSADLTLLPVCLGELRLPRAMISVSKR